MKLPNRTPGHALIVGAAIMFAGAAYAQAPDTPLTQHETIVKTTRTVVRTRHVTTHVGYTAAQERREREETADLNRHGVQVHIEGDTGE